MPNVEKVICETCDGYGKHRRNPLAPWNECDDCGGVGTIEHSVVKKSLTTADRASDAITLLYTHGLLTSAMRDHARKKLANL